MKNIKLSVLDQTPIRKGSNANQSLQETIELAKLADELGYTRYWLSEHHNSQTLATGSPEVMIARLGAETKNIRLGSGGMMMPNHSTLRVAENFRVLEALYPNRIDLGMGRAPGGDRLTAHLLNPSNTFDPQHYIQQLRDLQHLLNDEPLEGISEAKVKAIPIINTSPDLWILTSSGESAIIAAHFGMAVSFAQFINPMGGPEAIKLYKEKFQASAELSEPQTSVGIFGFCSEDEEKVLQVQALMDYRLLSFERGQFNQQFSYDDIKDEDYDNQEWQRVLHNRKRMAIGTPEVMKEKIEKICRDFDTDEVLISTFTDFKEDRFNSYRLLAKYFDLKNDSVA
ncbi:LLM class flavin-dependent oxidoreductase [Pedobacter cryophilus]|uniref:LLM class flavin-dependent oxidoreductase n=1 Tax=Pedobacter cryophilus TaxID=2571271 RepID=A0A4U1C1J4_9SPHI|nr:LLM class flavin-dependent oxidoreductase [Pedobacter cryophilus]TKB98847.1 LLM class flavin-dependent oxidoreductase [Pedobacter cryophilus]